MRILTLNKQGQYMMDSWRAKMQCFLKREECLFVCLTIMWCWCLSSWRPKILSLHLKSLNKSLSMTSNRLNAKCLRAIKASLALVLCVLYLAMKSSYWLGISVLALSLIDQTLTHLRILKGLKTNGFHKMNNYFKTLVHALILLFWINKTMKW